jgi:succinoglycan biosynthesis transport protein ExoP
MHNAIVTGPGNSLTPRVGVEAFFRQRRLFWWVAVSVFVAVAVITFLRPKQYSSEMKLLVQNTRGNMVVTAERTSPANVSSDVSETQVNSELEILRSHDVLDPVADPDWATIPQQNRTLAAIRHHEKLVTAFEKSLNTEIVRKTNVINVTLSAKSPEKAKSDLDRLLGSYLAEHRRLQRPNGTSNFFESEAERIRKDWDAASQKLVEFQQTNQLVSLPEREAAINNQVVEHERDLLATDVALRELDTRLAVSSRGLKDLPMRQTTTERTLPNQQSVEHLNTLLVELKNKRTTLITNYKSSDRLVRELDEEIATTEAALNNAAVSTSHEEASEVDPAWEQLHKDYVQAGISRKQTATHREAVAAELAALRQNLKTLQESTVTFNNLESQVNELKQNYDLYAQKRDQAQIEDAMDNQKLLNVVVAQVPTVSYRPINSKPLTGVVLAMVTSLFLGICVIYLAEIGRSTIATPRELDALSRYPVLATVPRVAGWLGRIEKKPSPRAHFRGLPQDVSSEADNSMSPSGSRI